MTNTRSATEFEVIDTPPRPRRQPLLRGLVFLECVAVFCAVFTVIMVIVT